MEDVEQIGVGLYEDSMTEARKEYNNRINEVKNHKEFKNNMKEFMTEANKNHSFEIVIGDDEDKRLAFTETLRHLYNTRNHDTKVLVKAYNLNDKYRWFTLSDQRNIETNIGHIAGTIDLMTSASDRSPQVANEFLPARYELLFLRRDKRKGDGRSNFQIFKRYDKDEYHVEVVEIDDDYRAAPDGGFFPYINLAPIDLTDYQIFSEVNKKNYKDTCFVYACIQSGVFSKEEIHVLKDTLKTRNFPNNKVYDVAKQFKTHFIIRRIDENVQVKHQMMMKVDTRKKEWAADYKRTVDLLLYKNHYMIYKPIPVTTYYLEHFKELDKEFSGIPIEKRRMIRGLTKEKYPKFQKEDSLPMSIFRKMFELGLFREIKQCEMNILATTEYSDLNDYSELDYDEDLCTKLITKNEKKHDGWSEIYYSDFETNVTVSPHEPYMNVTVFRENEKMHILQFLQPNINGKLLSYLKNGSLIYFHNLKYDACFFMNTPGWQTKVMERSGTVLQIIMTKQMNVRGKTFTKTLTFRNSYSIIPAPLRSFADMFHLDVHKEVMAYKLYTSHNIRREIVSALEFQIQYFSENRDTKSFEEIRSDWKQLIENAKIANAYNEKELTIDIMKYAFYYCKKDCIVLMKGVEKFDDDLSKVFGETKTKMLSVHHYISISSIGYNFAENYGCFEGCYQLSSKPQNFIQRCVSGGRTMTANNRKQYVEGKIQDFDAVSLYPSAMSIMPGVPKGVPKVIPSDILTEELLSFDTFFAEINITKIRCKSKYEYKFGQIFRRNKAGSKLFDNKPINNFYIDKVGFQDLLEYYEFEYEFVRGYYFEDGFNNKINDFITILFNLRLKYKKEHNPLQSTIKLLLNSIYGKSILKAMPTETKCVPREHLFKYIYRNYNYITEVIDEPNVSNVYVKKLKAIDLHYNLPQFGASVLSWSKHIMNQVMCLAEQNGIEIYYQDTDSMHLREDDLPKLADLFQFNYHKQLIGSNMCQFHNDFDGFEGAVGKIYSKKLIALGKKSYLDILVDEKGNEGYHIRMKGVPKQCVINKCKRMGITIEELYERMYNGEAMTFDLLDGSNCFRKTKCYQQTNLPTFNRRVVFH